MNAFLAHFDLQLAIQSLLIGAGLVMAITATEMLVRFQVYARPGVLSWDLGRRAPHIYNRLFRRRLGDFFYHDRRFRALFVFRLAIGLGLIACGIFTYLSPPLLGAALLSSLLVVYRAGPGQDGSPTPNSDPHRIIHLFHQSLGFPPLPDRTVFSIHPADPVLPPGRDCQTPGWHLARWNRIDRDLWHGVPWQSMGL